MGVQFDCGEVSISCGYGTWNEIRFYIAKACLDFFIELTKDVDPNVRDISTQYHCHLLDLVEGIQKRNPESIVDFLSAIEDYETHNTLIFFGMNGLHKLIAKSDCEGFYSPGDSMDIGNMLTLIEPYLSPQCEDITQFKELFIASVVFNENVMIS
jgi:hypothetical protein